MNVLLVDHYDSFTLNLANLVFASSGQWPDIRLHDDPYLATCDLGIYSHIILGPGPGHPENLKDFWHSRRILADFYGPILGVCLGHQGIGLYFGGKVQTISPAHGIISAINHTGTGLFQGIASPWPVVRYHSLALSRLGDKLLRCAATDDNIIMAFRHCNRPIWGVQFHPESIATEQGIQLLQNFFAPSVYHQTRCPTSPPISRSTHPKRPTSRLCHARVPLSHTPEQIFAQLLGHEAWAFWLDGQGSMATHCIMGTSSLEQGVRLHYRQNQQCIEWEQAGIYQTRTQALHTFMHDWSKTLEIPDELAQNLECDFMLGWVGMHSYEMLQERYSIKRIHHNQHPDALWIWCDQALILYPEKGYADVLWESGYETSRPKNWLERVSVAFNQRIDSIPIPIPSALQLHADLGRSTYLDRIRTAQQALYRGDSYELCLTQQIRAVLPEDPWSLYGRMRQINPVPMGAYFKSPYLTVLSGSPEEFLHRDRQGLIRCSPIKGTRPRSSEPETDLRLAKELASSGKDQAENLMIVDLTRHDLANCCEPGSIKVDHLFRVQSFPGVHQMMSQISGLCQPHLGPWEVLYHMFPGGSMTGAPKKRSLEILNELEISPRGIYSGCLGYMSANGSMHLSIVIRTLILQGNQMSYGVGGAITIQSDPDLEYEETLVKAQLLSRLFPGTNLGGQE